MTLEKSRDERISFKVDIPRLYREELREIARIIDGEFPGGLRIDFHDDLGQVGSEPEDIDRYGEIEGISDNLKSITYFGRRDDTQLTFHLSGMKSELVVLNPDNGSRGAATQIRQICKDNRRSRIYSTLRQPKWTSFFFRAFVVCVALFVVVFVLLNYMVDPPHEANISNLSTGEVYQGSFEDLDYNWLTDEVRGPNGEPYYQDGFYLVASVYNALYSATTVVPWIILFLIFFVSFLRRGAVLINMPRSTRPTWWQRNSTAVMLMLVSSILGGVIGFFVNLFTPGQG